MLADARRELLADLERAIGYRFHQLELLNQALTHKSYVHEHREPAQHNERLEFLGDAVLGLVISDHCFGRFAQLAEGELSKIRASLVNESNLARIARRLDLGIYLLVGRGEELTGGRMKTSLLADTFEALLAAIYLDGSLDAVYRVVLRCFQDDLKNIFDEGHKDFKSELQEYTQEKFGCVPTYLVVRERGPDHEKVFEVELTVRGQLQGLGAGKSKKEAEQAAARKVLAAFIERERGLFTNAILGPPEQATEGNASTAEGPGRQH
jgi:ribonuclease III